jgi:two-component system sensor histidine kinase KdpD
MLFELSRDLVARMPGPEMYQAVLERLVREFGFSAAALHVQEATAFHGLREQVTVGAMPGEIPAQWNPMEERPPERLPLSVGGRVLGLIVLSGDRPPLTTAESRVLRAFCDQFALILERDRLLRAATEADLYRHSEGLRRSMLAAVSHDLRSPLSAIKASVTDLLAEDGSRDQAYVNETLDAIRAETERLEDMITNLLDMGRFEAGILRARTQHVDLTEAIASSSEVFRRHHPAIGLTVHVADTANGVSADPAFLERVLTNLLENAARASSGAGENVELLARRVNGRVTVRVVDHGPGISEADREQLFHPFFRLDDRGARLGPGLGLAITKGFLSLMNGEIWVEDTRGGGATLAFTLPADDGGEEQRAHPGR